MSETKTCPRCGETKPKTDYYKTKKSPNSIASKCKACISKVMAEYRSRNAEKVKERKREWWQRVKEVQNEKRRLQYVDPSFSEMAKKHRIASDTTRRNNIPDSNVLQILYAYSKKPPHVPAELIEAKRLQLKIKRFIKEKTK